MAVPLHSKFRREIKNIVNKILILITTKKNNTTPINPNEIKRILIVRVNYRIGNIIFLTPLLKALSKKIPDAKVDVLIGAPYTIPVLKDIPNIKNVYDTPRKLLKNPIALIKKVLLINKNNYDLIISPTGYSASSNFATLLLKAKYKLGFYSKDTWSPINKTVIASNIYTHEALKPLELMNIFSGEKLIYDEYLDISLSDNEKLQGKQILNKFLIQNNITNNYSYIIGIFRDARFEKKIANSWWKEFIENIKKLDDKIIIIDILAPNQEKFDDNISSISIKNLRELSKFFSSLDAFICADTGPMHLASASLTPVIALFNETSPDLYGPLGSSDKVIQINNKNITSIAQETYEHLGHRQK